MIILTDDADREALHEHGENLYEDEQYIRAVQVFHLLLENFPSDIRARALMADCYVKLELVGPAIKELEYLKRHEELSSMDLEQTIECYKFNIVDILFETCCFEAAIPILKKRIEEEPTDYQTRGKLAFSYSTIGEHLKALEHYTQVYNSLEDLEQRSIFLPYRIEMCKKLNDVKQVADLIAELWELKEQGYSNPDLLYHLSADEYLKSNFNESLDLLSQAQNLEESDDEIEKSEDEHSYDRYFKGILALNLVLDKKEDARMLCVEWIESFSECEVDSRRDIEVQSQVNACIQSLKDADLMYRLAESVFLRTSAPSLEFAYKALAARWQGNNEKVYQEFIKYKQTLREQIENRGDSFEDVWEEIKSGKQEIADFVIPDPEPPIAKLADEYIEKYGK